MPYPPSQSKKIVRPQSSILFPELYNCTTLSIPALSFYFSLLMITFENISKQYGSTVLLQEVSFSIHESERTGLIGANGSGKTTLLRMLSGEEQPDSGSIRTPSDLKIGYLPQEVEVLDDKTPLEIVLAPFAHVLDFEQQIQSVSATIHQDLKTALKKMDSLYDMVTFHDGYSLVSRAKAILCGLGIPEDNWSQPVQVLSGGYRMRAVLGSLLLLSPDFMLLDEPTNHLDMDSLVWLEKYLARQNGGMLIVSHDRDFLNRITTHTAEITRTGITIAKGNYDQYMTMKAEAEEAAEKRARNLEIKIKETERFVERFKAKATKATQAQSRMKLLDKLRAELPVLASNRQAIHFTFPEPKPSGAVPLKFQNVSAGYGAVPVLQNISLTITRGDKIAIVGPNGAGKSTFLKVIAGLITASEGMIEPGHNVSMRYFGQHQLEQLDPCKSLYETVIADSVCTEKTFVRNILGAFLFSGDAVEKQVSVLSGGEKARLVLATILANPGNVLLLDEPTNHLDIDSVDMLANAMAAFKGTILFVSHDEYFISKIATRIIEIRPGSVRDFPGTLHDYRVYIETLFSDEQTGADAKRQEKTQELPQKEVRIRDREYRKKLTRTVEKLEREIAAREEAVCSLQAIIDNPENALNHELLHATMINIDSEQSSIENLMQEWERKHLELEGLE